MHTYKIHEAAEIQEYFSSLKNIVDFVSIEYTAGDKKLLLVYFVAPIIISAADVFSKMPSELHINAVVQVSRIPNNTLGNIAIEELLKCEILDAALINDLNSRFNNELKPEVAFSIEPRYIKPKYYHINDLLPDLNVEKNQTKSEINDSAVDAATIDVIAERPSFSSGGALHISSESPQTLTEAILKTASTVGSKRGITYIDEHGEEEFQTYAQLLTEAKRILSGLLSKHMKPGDSAILQLTKFSDHFATFWACVLGGIVPVTVAVASSYRESNAVTDKLINTWKHLKQPVILTNSFLVEDLSYLMNNNNLKHFNLVEIDNFYEYAEVTEDQIYKCAPDDLIFYQLTSGSTGTPKCIQEKHSSIISHIIGSKIFNNYSDAEISLNWLPLDHVVPILTCHLRDVYLGYNQVMVRTMRVISQPLRWLDLLEQYRVTLSWAPNFGFKLVSDKLIENKNSKLWDLSCVHYLMNAGEQVTSFVMEEFYTLTKDFGIKENMLQPAFGMAEVCTCMTYHNNFSNKTASNTFLKSSLSGKLQFARNESDLSVSFVDLGPPIPGVEIRIADDTNNMLNEGYIGRFQIRGNVVTPGYLYNDAANKDAFVGDGWFNTGDIGFILNGRLTLTGRQKEMIIIRGSNYYCYEIEDCVNSIEGVQPTYVAATSAINTTTGTEELAIFFVYKDNPSLDLSAVVKAIKQKINKNFALDVPFIIPLPRADFPKTTSGKIQRGQLKSQLQEGSFNEQLKQLEILNASHNTLPNWFFTVKWLRDNYISKSSSIENNQSCLIVFYNDCALADKFIEQISNKNYVTVMAASDYKRSSDKTFEINPLRFDDYLKLFDSITSDGFIISEVVNFYFYDAYTDVCSSKDVSAAFDREYSLLKLLLKALIKYANKQVSLKILIISSFLHYVLEDDKIAPQKSLISGLVNAVANENEVIRCCSIDIPLSNDATIVTSEADMIIKELDSSLSETEVAFRNGLRYTPYLINAALKLGSNNSSLLKSNDTYIITGGMGGIGRFISELLMQRYKARVIALGNTKTSDVDSQKLQKLSKLGSFEYYCVDVTDFDQIANFKKEVIETKNLHVDGIFHLAGIYKESAIEDLNQDDTGSTVRTKVLGALHLNLLFSDPNCFFTSFSSVTASFGGALISEYAAANRFLDSYSTYLVQKGKESRCIEWCIWNDVGVSKDYPGTKMLNSKGFAIIDVKDGLLSFEVAMCQDFSTLIVGIDPTKTFIRHKSIEQDFAVQQLSAICASSAVAETIQKSKILDLLGNSIKPYVVVLDKSMLVNVSTVQDLLNIFKNKTNIDIPVLPSGETEIQISKIIQGYLNLKSVDVNCNFFDLGANSTLLMAICDDINNYLSLKLSLVEMFKYSSVKKLSEFIEGTNTTGNSKTVLRKPIRRRIFKDRGAKHDD
jgi:acyl-CoA synthetase (AMP-forming)/AMP-acid ligase II/acyl carrier protein